MLHTLLAILLALPPAPKALADSIPKAPDSLRVPILVYHNIQPASEAGRVRSAELTMRPEVFAAQMQYLADNKISVVSLGALVDALEGKGRVPARAVVITFDDGRVNQYANALPVLRKHGFTATFFPFTHAMDRNARYFTWAQLREMQEMGMTIGSHTSLHVRVDRMKDAKMMDTEVRGSRVALQKNLGGDAAFFSYPFGALASAGDSAVRAAGYRAARAYTGKSWNSARDIWRLNAVAMSESMARFRQTVDPQGAPAAREASTSRAARTGASAPARSGAKAKANARGEKGGAKTGKDARR